MLNALNCHFDVDYGIEALREIARGQERRLVETVGERLTKEFIADKPLASGMPSYVGTYSTPNSGAGPEEQYRYGYNLTLNMWETRANFTIDHHRAKARSIAHDASVALKHILTMEKSINEVLEI